jgi:DNA polymerase III epsilon subunit-like protein
MANTNDPPLPALAFIDTETSGLDPYDGARVLELGVCRVPFNPDAWPADPVIHVFRFRLNERDQWYAQPKALEINGYRSDHPDWSGAPTLDTDASRAAWKQAAALLTDAALVSQNIPFDRGFLQSEFRLHKLDEPKWARRALDLQSYSFLISLTFGLKKWGLHEVYPKLELPELQEHRAAADIRRGLAVFQYAVKNFRGGQLTHSAFRGLIGRAKETPPLHDLLPKVEASETT